MLARGLFHEHDKGLNPVSSHDLYWENKIDKQKRSILQGNTVNSLPLGLQMDLEG